MVTTIRSAALVLGSLLVAACASSATPSGDERAIKSTTSALVNADVSPEVLGVRPGRVHIETPALDVNALHERWRREFLGRDEAASCHWRPYRVEEGRASLAGALADAHRDRSVCGPVIVLAPGRYDETPLFITKPTIIVGETVQIGDNAPTRPVLSTTLVSTAGQPLWLQNVTIEDAPFPGAIFASHPSIETTLSHVRIDRATGVGVVHNGGVISMYNTVITNTKAVTRRDFDDDPRVNRQAVRHGYGQPHHRKASPGMRRGSLPTNFQILDDLVASDVGEGFHPYYARKLDLREFQPVGVIEGNGHVDLIGDDCTGVGAMITGGSGYLSGDQLINNPHGGLAVVFAAVQAVDVITAYNGYDVDDSNPDALIKSRKCFGGFQIRGEDDAVLVAEGGGSVFDAAVGLAAQRKTDAFLGTWTTHSTASPSGEFGDNVVGWKRSFVAMTDFDSYSAFRAGLLFDRATVNLYSGRSHFNQFGLVTEEYDCSGGPQVYVGDDVTLSSNIEADRYDGGDLCLPDEPAPLPD